MGDRDTEVAAASRVIRSMVLAGYSSESVFRAVEANDLSLLRHTARHSVQLQDPEDEQDG